MNIGKRLFIYRRFAPVPFFIAGVLLADPRHDLVVFGALLMAAGELLRLAAVSYTGPAIRSHEIYRGELVTNGPFAYLRNPVYFGNLLLYSGASILCGAWLPYLLYIVIIFFTIYYSFCIRYEEKQLHEAFGRSYQDYLNMVPRFFPRLSAYPDRGNKQADMQAGFRAEAATFLTIGGFLIFTWLKWAILN